MGKVNLDNVRGITTFSVRVGEGQEFPNGSVVGLGNLIDGEYNLYEAVEATPDNCYLVTTPEIDRTSNSDSIDKVNKEGEDMRVHQLEKGDIFTVEKGLHDLSGYEAGHEVSAAGKQFIDAGADAAAIATVLDESTIGGDRRKAVSLRVL